MERSRARTRLAIALGIGALLGLLLFAGVSLFVGVYEHREFANRYVFIKHRPAFKWYFYSPCGESDRTLASLAPDKAREETAFVEFVERGRGSSRAFCITPGNFHWGGD